MVQINPPFMAKHGKKFELYRVARFKGEDASINIYDGEGNRYNEFDENYIYFCLSNRDLYYLVFVRASKLTNVTSKDFKVFRGTISNFGISYGYKLINDSSMKKEILNTTNIVNSFINERVHLESDGSVAIDIKTVVL